MADAMPEGITAAEKPIVATPVFSFEKRGSQVNQVAAEFGNSVPQMLREDSALAAKKQAAIEIANNRTADMNLNAAEFQAEVVAARREADKQLLGSRDFFQKRVEDHYQRIQKYDEAMKTNNPIKFIVSRIQRKGAEKFLAEDTMDLNNVMDDLERNTQVANKSITDYNAQVIVSTAAKNTQDLGVATKGIEVGRTLIDGDLKAKQARLKAAQDMVVYDERALKGLNDSDRNNVDIEYMIYKTYGNGTVPRGDKEIKAAMTSLNAMSPEQRASHAAGLQAYMRAKDKNGGNPPEWQQHITDVVAGGNMEDISLVGRNSGQMHITQMATEVGNEIFTTALETEVAAYRIKNGLAPNAKLTPAQAAEVRVAAQRTVGGTAGAVAVQQYQDRVYAEAAKTAVPADGSKFTSTAVVAAIPYLESQGISPQVTAILNDPKIKGMLDEANDRTVGLQTKLLNVLQITPKAMQAQMAEALTQVMKYQVKGTVETTNGSSVVIAGINGGAVNYRLSMRMGEPMGTMFGGIGSDLTRRRLAAISGETEGISANMLEPLDLLNFLQRYQATTKNTTPSVLP